MDAKELIGGMICIVVGMFLGAIFGAQLSKPVQMVDRAVFECERDLPRNRVCEWEVIARPDDGKAN